MATDTVLNELILQEVTQAEYEQLEKDNLLDENRVYLTPDNSLKGNLFDFKWADHLLNDISWLRADTFSWHDGEMYKAAYNHLAADFEDTTAESETIDDIEITFYRAEDGHKICLQDQEDKLLALYNATGVAWYYILDTGNKQFKLPRTKFGITGLRDEVGNYVPESVPSFSASFITTNTGGGGLGTAGAISGEGYNAGAYSGGGGRTNSAATLTIDPSITTAAYQSNAAVQERATQVYLYFYVGNFERDAVEQTAGVTTEMLNNKADVDLSNMSASQSAKETIVGWGMPDYSAGVSAPSTNTIAQTDIYVKSETQTGIPSLIYINDVIVANGWEGFVCAYVPKGATFRVTGANAVYYPLKGVN